MMPRAGAGRRQKQINRRQALPSYGAGPALAPRCSGAGKITYPMLTLMSVYFWSLHRTDLLPATAVFAIGLFLDILTGLPLGLNAFILLGVFGLCVTQRRFFYNKSFAVIWWGFMVVAAAAMLIEWILMSIYLETLVSPKPIYFRYFLTVALYPPIAWLFVRIQRSLPQETV